MAGEDGGDEGVSPQEQQQISGISAIDYAQWRNHPVTLMFRKYLTDFRGAVIKSEMDSWLAGEKDLSLEQERRGFVNALEEAADIPFDVIHGFYNQPQQDGGAEDAAEAAS